MGKRKLFQWLIVAIWAFLLMFGPGGKGGTVQAASSSLPSLQFQLSALQPEYVKPPNADARGRLDVTLNPQGAVSTIIRPPIDVVFVMDVSGSMTAMKLQSAKSALQAAVNYFKSNYNQNDRFALIPFSDGVREASVVPFGKYSNVASQLDAILNTGNSLTAGGGTNYSAALSLAQSYFNDPVRKKYVIFLTDGMPTTLNATETITYREVERILGFYYYTGEKITAPLPLTYELYTNGTAGICFTDKRGFSRLFTSDGWDYVNGADIPLGRSGYPFSYSSIEKKIRDHVINVAKALGMNNITLYSIGFGSNDEVDMSFLQTLSATAGGEARQGTTQNLASLFQRFSQLATTPALTGTVRIPLSSFGGNVTIEENGQVWLDETKQNAYISFSIPYQVGQGTPAPVTIPIAVSFKAKGTYTFTAELTYRDVYGQPQPAVTKTVTVTVKDEAPPSFTGTVKLQGLTNDVTSLIKRGATDGDDNRFRATYSLSLVGYVGNATGTISNVKIVQELPDGISVVPDGKVVTYEENGKRYAQWSFADQTFDYSQLNKLTLSAQWVMQADFAMSNVQLPPAVVTFADSRYGVRTSTLSPPAERIGMRVRLDDFPNFYYEGDESGLISKWQTFSASSSLIGTSKHPNSYGLLQLPVKALQYDPTDDGVLLVTYSNGQTVPVYIKPHLLVTTSKGTVANGAMTYEAPTVKLMGPVAGEGVSYQYQIVRNGVASAWTALSSPYEIPISNDGSYTVNVQSSGGLTRGTGIGSAVFAYTKLITELKFGSYQTTMNVGDVQTIPVTIVPSDATNKTLVWSSSDNAVAVVQNGVVTALKPGTVAITVRSTDGGNASATASIRVIDPYVALTGMAFRNPVIYMNPGDRLEVAEQLRFIPENATDKTLRSVTSSDSRFVDVVQENGRWCLEAVDVGYAVVTATANARTPDGRPIQASVWVFVQPREDEGGSGSSGGRW